MSKLNPSFRFYTTAAPFPGACVFSGETTNLWEVGSLVVQGQALPVLLSDRVLTELATSVGFVTGKSYAELNAVKQAKIDELQAQVDAAPQLLKELSTNVNGILTNFAIALADVASSAISSNNKASEANAPFAPTDDGAAAKAGQGKKPSTKPSPEPAS